MHFAACFTCELEIRFGTDETSKDHKPSANENDTHVIKNKKIEEKSRLPHFVTM